MMGFRDTEERNIVLLSVVLLFPALLIHLGYLPLNFPTDEPRRALVALEMILSGDYLTPTLNGELYFNKPPLYNWIIAASFLLHGDFSMWALRLPVVISLILFGFTTFWFVRRYINATVAFLSAAATVTCARFLFYDSFLGLIDTTFAWLVYVNFMLVYHFRQKNQWYALFVVTYLITAVTYLMKGLPSLVFQGTTLLAYLSYRREFKRLFSLPHIVGGLLFLAIVGTYYVAYFTRNAIPLEEVFSTIWTESSKRTGLKFGVWPVILHLFTFPFEVFYHFAPWLLLLLPLFRRDFWRQLKAHPFVFYNALVFAANIIVYWTSPQVYMRYLFMFMPPLFTVTAYFYYEHTPLTNWRRKTVEWVLLAAGVLLCLGCAALPFLEVTRHVPYPFLKAGACFVAMCVLMYLYYTRTTHRLAWFVPFLLVVRIAFNWFVLPPRQYGVQEYVRHDLALAEMTQGRRVWLYGVPDMSDPDSFYMASRRGEVLSYAQEVKPGELYLVPRTRLDEHPYRELYRMPIYSRDTLVLVTLDPPLYEDSASAR
ncbi:4-amino-4-deoxy-L-arabinose transferase [Catalinimonas alkaloidigena]|uniref:4-amino-4-deoxy-L-arabinose transferase n=1 Tax=Catalinimonas alkaloidigena TaxID=1075417 RepID=A0A1G9D8Y7_9BACT|nr:glycosyltransferase family 39 protein [Catalinimonas alkaloidigena]SDK60205.1 4-amino-4-deoxy-L-arabinose transferase [Catalinimonas alkaloidigena]